MDLSFEMLPKAVTDLLTKVGNIERLLTEKTVNQQPDTDQILDIDEAAVFLKLSKASIYGLVSRAEIPVNKKGKRLYFSRKELTDWVKLGRKKTQTELAADAQTYISKHNKKRA
jgi:excisionase family DNA binding protein